MLAPSYFSKYLKDGKSTEKDGGNFRILLNFELPIEEQ